MRLLWKGFAAASLIGALLPATAGASVTIGNPLTRATDGGFGADEAVLVTTASRDPSTRMSSPVNGTVVSWNVRGSTPTGGPNVLTLRVVRPSGTDFLGAGSSSPQTLPTVLTDLTRSFDTSIPIRIGDRIAIGGGPGAVVPATGLGDPSLPTSFKAYDAFADGSPSGPPMGGGGGGELQFNAVVAPTNLIGVSGKTRNKRRGTAILHATLPNSGTLDVGGKLVKPQTVTAPAAGDLDVTLRPSRKAKRKLKRTGRASGKIALTFTPAFGDPGTLKTPLRLIRKRRP